MAFLLNSQSQGASGKMNNLPKHHGAGTPEARGPMQLHRLKAGGPVYLLMHIWTQHISSNILPCWFLVSGKTTAWFFNSFNSRGSNKKLRDVLVAYLLCRC